MVKVLIPKLFLFCYNKNMKINLTKSSALSWRSVFDKLSELSWLLAIFIVPLFFAAFLRTENIIELNKIFLAQVFLILLFFFTLSRELFFPAKLWRNWTKFFKKFWLLPSIFILGLAISLLFSDNKVLSFFGTIDRQQGFLSYLLYFFWFILLSFNLAVFRERDLEIETAKEVDINTSNIKPGSKKLLLQARNRIFLAILASAFLASIYGILQFLGLDIYHWQEAALYTGRAFSSLGQPNFFASWLLLVSGISFLFFYQEKKFLPKSIYFLIFLTILLALISSGSRGALVAFFASLFIFLVYLFFSSKVRLTLRKKLVLSGLVLALVFVFAFSLELILPGRISSLVDGSGGSVSARLDFYQASVSAIKAEPLFGYGQENLYEAFLPYYQTSWGVHGDVGQAPDKAHNLLLDILMSHGFFGLIFYSLFFSFFFFLVFRLLKSKDFHYQGLALGFGAFAYLFSLLFSFAVVSTEFYFFIFLALLVSFNYKAESLNNFDLSQIENLEPLKTNAKKLFTNKKFKIFIFILILVISFLGLECATRVYSADYYFFGARQAYVNQSLPEALTFLDYVDKAKTNPVNRAYYARTAASLILPFYPFKEELSLEKLVKDRLDSALIVMSLVEVNDLLMRARILTAFDDFEKANLYLDLALKKSPQWPISVLAEARISLAQGDKDRALKAFYLLLAILPETSNPLLNQNHLNVVRSFRKEALVSIAEIFTQESNYLAAENYYRLAYLEDVLDYSLLKKIADQLYLQAKFEEALVLVIDGSRLNPGDYNWPLMASYLTKKLGRELEADIWYSQALALGFKEDLNNEDLNQRDVNQKENFLLE